MPMHKCHWLINAFETVVRKEHISGNQCRRQSKSSEGALAESVGGALK